jgi:hypothetical protein
MRLFLGKTITNLDGLARDCLRKFGTPFDIFTGLKSLKRIHLTFI